MVVEVSLEKKQGEKRPPNGGKMARNSANNEAKKKSQKVKMGQGKVCLSLKRSSVKKEKGPGGCGEGSRVPGSLPRKRRPCRVACRQKKKLKKIREVITKIKTTRVPDFRENPGGP